jgi:hypothetical protein
MIAPRPPVTTGEAGGAEGLAGEYLCLYAFAHGTGPDFAQRCAEAAQALRATACCPRAWALFRAAYLANAAALLRQLAAEL